VIALRLNLFTSHSNIILSILVSLLLLSTETISAKEADGLTEIEKLIAPSQHLTEDINPSAYENWNPAILAIKGWQQISFNTPLLNCQFEPCCSKYGIHSIREHGIFPGILYAADRISRCHPFAFRYYLSENSRLGNKCQTGSYFRSDRLPWLTIPISFVLPGFNKMVNGRFWDGFSILVVTSYSGYRLLQGYETREYRIYLSSFIFSTFYLSDIYFNILSVMEEG
jgi:putative component of membrane protein insertase Oxa1/YidC/SpoIIIJ protein YidD